MSKKGQGLTLNTVILAALGVIVLVILIVVVRQQITKSAGRVERLGGEAELNASKCASLILGQQCAANDCPEGFEFIPSPPGGWDDCRGTQANCCRRR